MWYHDTGQTNKKDIVCNMKLQKKILNTKKSKNKKITLQASQIQIQLNSHIKSIKPKKKLFFKYKKECFSKFCNFRNTAFYQESPFLNSFKIKDEVYKLDIGQTEYKKTFFLYCFLFVCINK